MTFIFTNNNRTAQQIDYQERDNDPKERIITGYTASGHLFQLFLQFKEEKVENDSIIDNDLLPNIDRYADYLINWQPKGTDEEELDLYNDFLYMFGANVPDSYAFTGKLREKLSGIGLIVNPTLKHDGHRSHLFVMGNVKMVLNARAPDLSQKISIYQTSADKPIDFFIIDVLLESEIITFTNPSELTGDFFDEMGDNPFYFIDQRTSGSIASLNILPTWTHKTKLDLAFELLDGFLSKAKSNGDCKHLPTKQKIWNLALQKELPRVTFEASKLRIKLDSATNGPVDKNNFFIALMLINRLISDPTLSHGAMRVEYENLVRNLIDGHGSAVWQNFGKALMVLGIALFALNVTTISLAVAGVAAAAIGYGFFAHGQPKGLAKAMSNLHEELENTAKIHTGTTFCGLVDDVVVAPSPRFY